MIRGTTLGLFFIGSVLLLGLYFTSKDFRSFVYSRNCLTTDPSPRVYDFDTAEWIKTEKCNYKILGFKNDTEEEVRSYDSGYKQEVECAVDHKSELIACEDKENTFVLPAYTCKTRCSEEKTLLEWGICFDQCSRSNPSTAVWLCANKYCPTR